MEGWGWERGMGEGDGGAGMRSSDLKHANWRCLQDAAGELDTAPVSREPSVELEEPSRTQLSGSVMG